MPNEDEDLDLFGDIPPCDIPEVYHNDDYCDHCDDDAPAPEMV